MLVPRSAHSPLLLYNVSIHSGATGTKSSSEVGRVFDSKMRSQLCWSNGNQVMSIGQWVTDSWNWRAQTHEPSAKILTRFSSSQHESSSFALTQHKTRTSARVCSQQTNWTELTCNESTQLGLHEAFIDFVSCSETRTVGAQSVRALWTIQWRN